MYMILADYGFRCAFADSKSYKNIQDAKVEVVELEKHYKALQIKYKTDYILKDTKFYDVKYFVVHESEVENELY